MPIIIDTDKCEGCGDCVDVCSTESIKIVNDKAVVDVEECIECEACIDECPNDAISIED